MPVFDFSKVLNLTPIEFFTAAAALAPTEEPQAETRERWVLGDGGKSGKNCPACIEFADMGWQALGFFPAQREATTFCQDSCGCGMEYDDGQQHDDVERITDWYEWTNAQ